MKNSVSSLTEHLIPCVMINFLNAREIRILGEKLFGVTIPINKSLLSCVRTNIKNFKYFNCLIGVRQGYVLSPSLLPFTNQVANHIAENDKHRLQIPPHILELFISFFADGVSLSSKTTKLLKNKIKHLNHTKTCLNSLGLTVKDGFRRIDRIVISSQSTNPARTIAS